MHSIPTVGTAEYDFFLLIEGNVNILLYNRPVATSSLSKRRKIIIGVVAIIIVLAAILGPALYFGIGSKNCVI